jgi:hypothetical protein
MTSLKDGGFRITTEGDDLIILGHGEKGSFYGVVNGAFSEDEDYRDWHRLDDLNEVFGRGYYVHTFNTLLPWETYFDAHPEYYCFMNGKRIKDQLCLSNEKVYRIALEKLKREMENQPGKRIWSVSQNDNFSYCQCPECEKIIEEEGSPAGPVIRFVNKIAGEFPDKTIATLAYQFSRPANGSIYMDTLLPMQIHFFLQGT